MTQTDKVLAYLKEGYSITPLKAMSEFSIWRLAHCIYVLRNRGYKIITVEKRGVSGGKYAQYTLDTGEKDIEEYIADEDESRIELKIGMRVYCEYFGAGTVGVEALEEDNEPRAFEVKFDKDTTDMPWFYTPDGLFIGGESMIDRMLRPLDEVPVELSTGMRVYCKTYGEGIVRKPSGITGRFFNVEFLGFEWLYHPDGTFVGAETNQFRKLSRA